MILEIVEAVLAVGHLIVAVSVTVHVLLTHRDVRSSIGWIGLGWLSPFVGGLVYYAFGINRVARRASRLKLPVPRQRGVKAHGLEEDLPANLAALAHAGNRLARHPLTDGNRVDFLVDGDRAYPEMLAAIDGAKFSVALCFYIFENDEIGRAFVAALIAAHGRGVAVRVLIDGVGGGYFRSRVYDALKDAGVPVALFLHSYLPWRMPFLNLRNHKKLLVTDGCIGFTGGMNISDRHIGGTAPPRVRDVMTRIEGPVIRQMLESFAGDWEYSTNETLSGDIWWPVLAPAGHAPLRAIVAGPDEDIAFIEEHWASAIEQAERRVRILTPYFLPEDRVLDVLIRAAFRGVSVEIVLPARSNHFYVDWATRAHLEALPLDRIACRLTPPPFDHSKLMSVDGRWCSFGSPNWDARSMRLNFEMMVECYDDVVTQRIDDLITRKCDGAIRLEKRHLAARPPLVRLRDASARLFLPYL